MKNILTVVLAVLCTNLISQNAVVTTTGNTANHVMRELSNFNKEAILFITQNNKNGDTLYPYTAGVRYINNSWNLSTTYQHLNFRNGTDFNVLAFPSKSECVFKHRVHEFGKNYSVIKHPKLSNNPTAILIITHDFSNNIVNNCNIGVKYEENEWMIYSEDEAAILKTGSEFNILIAEQGFQHKINFENIHPAWPSTSILDVNKSGASDKEMLFVTHRFTNRNIDRPWAVWSDSNKWHTFIANHGVTLDTTAINELINVYKFKLPFECKKQYERIVVIPQPIKELCPVGASRGDNEFGGGPLVNININLSVDPSGRYINANVYLRMQETGNDLSSIIKSWSRRIYTAPPGRLIASISSPTTSSVYNYRAPDAGAEFGICGEGQSINQSLNGCVSSISFVADTGAEDISNDENCKCDAKITSIVFNQMTILLN